MIVSATQWKSVCTSGRRLIVAMIETLVAVHLGTGAIHHKTLLKMMRELQKPLMP